MKYINGFLMAWGMFCRIPCPCPRWDENSRREMLSMFPLVGLMLGVVTCVIWYAISLIGLPPYFAGVIITGLYFWLTGYIHLDGFMDCSDALLSRRRELSERQRILKDSNVGAFAVISFVFMTAIFITAVTVFCEGGFTLRKAAMICLIFLFSRGLAAYDVITEKPMITSQYRPMREEMEIKSGGIASLVAVSSTAGGILIAAAFASDASASGALQVVCCILAVCIMQAIEKYAGSKARRQLGGMSGDISGYMIVTGEMCGLLLAAISLYIAGSFTAV